MIRARQRHTIVSHVDRSIAVLFARDFLEQPDEANRTNAKATDRADSEGAVVSAVASSAPEKEDMVPSSTGDQMSANAEQAVPEMQVRFFLSLSLATGCVVSAICIEHWRRGVFDGPVPLLFFRDRCRVV